MGFNEMVGAILVITALSEVLLPFCRLGNICHRLWSWYLSLESVGTTELRAVVGRGAAQWFVSVVCSTALRRNARWMPLPRAIPPPNPIGCHGSCWLHDYRPQMKHR